MRAALYTIAVVLALGLNGIAFTLLGISEACAAGPDVSCEFYLRRCVVVDAERRHFPCRPRDAFRLSLDGGDAERVVGHWRSGWHWRDLEVQRGVRGFVMVADGGRAYLERPRDNAMMFGRCE